MKISIIGFWLLLSVPAFGQKASINFFKKKENDKSYIEEKYLVLNVMFNYFQLSNFYGVEPKIICENYEIPFFPPYQITIKGIPLLVSKSERNIIEEFNCILVDGFTLNQELGYAGAAFYLTKSSKIIYFSLKRFGSHWSIVESTVVPS